MNDPSKLLTPKQVSELLQISEKTLAQARWRGRGPKFIRIIGTIRYAQDDLADYLAARRYQSSSEGKGNRNAS